MVRDRDFDRGFLDFWILGTVGGLIERVFVVIVNVI